MRSGLRGSEYAEQFKSNIKLMEKLVKKLPELESDPDLDRMARIAEAAEPGRAGGVGLRALRELLEEREPGGLAVGQVGGLKKVLTPEHHYLWLCAHHAEEYLR